MSDVDITELTDPVTDGLEQRPEVIARLRDVIDGTCGAAPVDGDDDWVDMLVNADSGTDIDVIAHRYARPGYRIADALTSSGSDLFNGGDVDWPAVLAGIDVSSLQDLWFDRADTRPFLELTEIAVARATHGVPDDDEVGFIALDEAAACYTLRWALHHGHPDQAALNRVAVGSEYSDGG